MIVYSTGVLNENTPEQNMKIKQYNRGTKSIIHLGLHLLYEETPAQFSCSGCLYDTGTWGSKCPVCLPGRIVSAVVRDLQK